MYAARRMEYEAYYELAQRGGREFEAGEYGAAQATFQSLLETDISDIDKCAMCLNLTVAAEKLQATPAEIEALYARAIAYERPHRRYGATERKADWLARQGRNRESLQVYEAMLTYAELADTDRARIRLNCDSLRSDFNRYSEAARDAAALLEAGKHDEAIAAFRQLTAADISDVDRSMMCYNVGRAYEQKGDWNSALKWYERGIVHERPHRRFMVAESLAYALSQHGQVEEGARRYEELLARPELSEADKLRIRGNLAAVRAGK
jgi:tetratricopeptide (TPR) repeat protein